MDIQAVNRWLGHIKETKPDKIIINGDLVDCWELSKFDRVPKGGKSIKDEMFQAKQFLESLRRITDCEVILIEGNHEFRIKRYMISFAPELWELEDLCLEKFLDLEKFNIKFVQLPEDCAKFIDNYVEDQGFLVGHFSCARLHSCFTVKMLVEKYGTNIIQGHTHRLGAFYKRTHNQQIVGVEGGCLCGLNPNYMKNPNWTTGYVDIIDGEIEIKRL